MMINWDEVRKVLERGFEVWEVRDPKINEERYRGKAKAIDWVISELKKGPIVGGTQADTDNSVWFFGTDEWIAIRDAIRVIYEDKCAICGKPAIEVHHIRPKHLKGKNHPRNLILLCNDCHDEVHRKIDNGIQAVLESSLDIPIKKESSTLEDFL